MKRMSKKGPSQARIQKWQDLFGMLATLDVKQDVKWNYIDAPNNSASYSIDQDGCKECFVYYHFDLFMNPKTGKCIHASTWRICQPLVNVMVKRDALRWRIYVRQLLHFFGILFKIHAVLDCAVSFFTMPFYCFDSILSKYRRHVAPKHILFFFNVSPPTIVRVHVYTYCECVAALRCWWDHRLFLSPTFIRKEQSNDDQSVVLVCFSLFIRNNMPGFCGAIPSGAAERYLPPSFPATRIWRAHYRSQGETCRNHAL
jgi:hypothetical protein